MFPSYRNQSNDLLSEPIDWFLHDVQINLCWVKNLRVVATETKSNYELLIKLSNYQDCDIRRLLNFDISQILYFLIEWRYDFHKENL